MKDDRLFAFFRIHSRGLASWLSGWTLPWVRVCQTKNEAKVGERVRACPRPCLMKEKETLWSQPGSLILDLELFAVVIQFCSKNTPFYSGMKNSETGNLLIWKAWFHKLLVFHTNRQFVSNHACFWNSLPLVLIGSSGVLLSIKRRLTSTVTKFKNEKRKIARVRGRDSHKAFLLDAIRTFYC